MSLYLLLRPESGETSSDQKADVELSQSNYEASIKRILTEVKINAELKRAINNRDESMLDDISFSIKQAIAEKFPNVFTFDKSVRLNISE